MNQTNDKQKPDILIPNKKWIYLDSHPVLRKISSDVSLPLNDELQLLVKKMTTYIDACYYDEYKQYHIRPGIAVAAPQMGVNVNIIYIHFDETNADGTVTEHKYLLANPKILQQSVIESYLEHGEGCLSVKIHYEGYVYRAKKILVEAIDLFTNEVVQINMDNFLSICCQHEIDHLHGILFYDHINKENPFILKPNAVKI